MVKVRHSRPPIFRGTKRQDRGAKECSEPSEVCSEKKEENCNLEDAEEAADHSVIEVVQFRLVEVPQQAIKHKPGESR